MMTARQLREGEERFDPSTEIRVWMVRSKIRPMDLARELGVSAAAITRFINGDLPSQRIREHFIKKGCPTYLLDQLRVKA